MWSSECSLWVDEEDDESSSSSDEEVDDEVDDLNGSLAHGNSWRYSIASQVASMCTLTVSRARLRPSISMRHLAIGSNVRVTEDDDLLLEPVEDEESEEPVEPVRSDNDVTSVIDEYEMV